MEKIVYLFPLFFIGIWIITTFIISKMGWSHLAYKYKLEGFKELKRIGIINKFLSLGVTLKK